MNYVGNLPIFYRMVSILFTQFRIDYLKYLFRFQLNGNLINRLNRISVGPESRVEKLLVM